MFGGGGTILRFREDTRCRMLFSILNRSNAAVTVEGITLPNADLPFQPLRIVATTRSRAPLNTGEMNCVGCWHDQVEFAPFEMAPQEEWQIGISTVMAGCTPPKAAGVRGTSSRAFTTVDVSLRALGTRRVVPVQLENPIALAVEVCGG